MYNFSEQQSETQDNSALMARLAELENKVLVLETTNEITRDISYEQQDAIREVVNDKLSDAVWNDFFYISKADPVGSVMTGGDVVRDGETNEQRSLSIKRESRLRVVFNLLLLGTGTTYFTTAHVRPVDGAYTIASTTGEWVAIKINGTKMYGVASRKGVQAQTVIKSDLATGDDYIVEIRFFPGERVDFYVDYEYAGTVSSNVPSDQTLEIYDWWYMEVTTGTSQIDVQRLEFMQKNK